MPTFFINSEAHARYRNYWVLLIAQLVLILLPALFDFIGVEWVASAAFTMVIFVSGYIVTNTRREFMIAISMALVSIISMWVDTFTEGDFFSAEGNVFMLIFFIYASFLMARERITTVKRIDINTLFAAICGFIFLGIIGGFFVRLVDVTSGGTAFNISLASDSYSYIYYSFVTITTLGYGDILPVTATAQAIAVLMAISGQMYITIVIALIVGQLIGGQISDAEDPKSTD